MPTMIEVIETAFGHVVEAESVLPGKIPEPTSGGPSVSGIISNQKLLLNDLKGLFENNSFDFFPREARSSIFAAILSCNANWDAVKAAMASNADFASAAIKYTTQCDKLYALCLSYSATTYGFNHKEVTKLIEEARVEYRALRKKARALHQAIEEMEGKVRLAMESGINTPIAENSKKLDELATQGANQLNSLLTEIENRQKKLDEIDGENESLAESIAKTSDSVSALSLTTAELAKTAKAAAEAATKSQAEAEAEAKAVATLRHELKIQIDAINEFFGEIGAHQTKMGEISNAAEARIKGLFDTAQEGVAANSNRVDAIIARVSNQQKQIDEHLASAAGASLFKAFDARRLTLSQGSSSWKNLAFLSTALAVALTIWIAHDLSGNSQSALTAAFYVKLTAAIPVAFAIAFCGQQYGRERRAEEEYAFKSAISLSLEPYEKLLKRLRSDGDHDPEFVKKLLLEVFDNPVVRIYGSKKETKQRIVRASSRQQEEPSGGHLLLRLVDSLDEDEIKTIKERLKKIVS